MNAPESFELRVSRFIRAPRERVYDAFVTESSMSAWQCPRGLQVIEARSDARVGGAWRVEMRRRDGTRYTVGGRYRELERPGRLAYTWRWEGGGFMPEVETLIEVDLVAADGGTELRMRHSGFPNEWMRDQHTHGWSSCFNRLVDLLDASGSAATLTLLGDPRSTYTRTARMGLAEKGVACTFQQAGPHSPPILAIHPFGRIPALRDGEFEVWETSAILRYLDDSFEGPPLVPSTGTARACCEQWVSAVNSYLYDTMVRRYVLQVLFPKGEGGEPDRGVIDTALAEMPRQLAALDRAYERSDWLAADALSLADLFVAPILAYVEAMPEGARLFEAVPNVRRAQAVMRARASFIDTQPERGTP